MTCRKPWHTIIKPFGNTSLAFDSHGGWDSSFCSFCGCPIQQSINCSQRTSSHKEFVITAWAWKWAVSYDSSPSITIALHTSLWLTTKLSLSSTSQSKIDLYTSSWKACLLHFPSLCLISSVRSFSGNQPRVLIQQEIAPTSDSCCIKYSLSLSPTELGLVVRGSKDRHGSWCVRSQNASWMGFHRHIPDFFCHSSWCQAKRPRTQEVAALELCVPCFRWMVHSIIAITWNFISILFFSQLVCSTQLFKTLREPWVDILPLQEIPRYHPCNQEHSIMGLHLICP